MRSPCSDRDHEEDRFGKFAHPSRNVSFYGKKSLVGEALEPSGSPVGPGCPPIPRTIPPEGPAPGPKMAAHITLQPLFPPILSKQSHSNSDLT